MGFRDGKESRPDTNARLKHGTKSCKMKYGLLSVKNLSVVCAVNTDRIEIGVLYTIIK